MAIGARNLIDVAAGQIRFGLLGRSQLPDVDLKLPNLCRQVQIPRVLIPETNGARFPVQY